MLNRSDKRRLNCSTREHQWHFKIVKHRYVWENFRCGYFQSYWQCYKRYFHLARMQSNYILPLRNLAGSRKTTKCDVTISTPNLSQQGESLRHRLTLAVGVPLNPNNYHHYHLTCHSKYSSIPTVLNILFLQNASL